MKQAIKVLQSRIELLGKEWNKKDADFQNTEMLSDYEFLKSDLANIELEILEHQEAIKILNGYVK